MYDNKNVNDGCHSEYKHKLRFTIEGVRTALLQSVTICLDLNVI
jgi:hypothetical protein